MMIARFLVAKIPRLCALPLIGILILPGCKSTTEVPCGWAESAMHIDGSAADWQDQDLTFLEEDRASIGIANDSSYLYFLLRSNNPVLIGSIRRFGITLWLDTEGGKGKDLGIQYIGGPTPEEMAEAGLADRREPGQRFSRVGRDAIFADSAMEPRFAFIDNTAGFEEIILIKDSSGPEVAYGIEDRFCVYELKIPFVAKAGSIYSISAGPGQIMGIGAVWNDLSGKMRPMSGGGRPEGGMPPGGGMRPASPPGGGMPGGPPTKEKEIWLKVQLADAAT